MFWALQGFFHSKNDVEMSLAVEGEPAAVPDSVRSSSEFELGECDEVPKVPSSMGDITLESLHEFLSGIDWSNITISERDINECDVLFETKATGASHPGTIHFGRIITEARTRYEPGDHSTRAQVIELVKSKLIEEGRRFIRKTGDDEPYYIMTDEEATTVVRESLCNSYRPPPSSSSELPLFRISNSAQSSNEDTSTAMSSMDECDNMAEFDVRDSQSSVSPSAQERIFLSTEWINDRDVLCGRSNSGTTHPGNASYLQMVASYKARYNSFGSTHKGKTAIRDLIIDELFSKGSRFVRKDDDGHAYYLLTLEEVRNKVSQSLRDKQRKRFIKR